jgi:hypothetical protein
MDQLDRYGDAMREIEEAEAAMAKMEQEALCSPSAPSWACLKKCIGLA